MDIVPADGQWLGLPDSVGVTTAKSDPYPLGGNDRASAALSVERIYGGATSGDRSIAFSTQVSLDGVNWVNQGPSGTTTDVTTATTAVADTDDVNGAFVRFIFTFAVTSASGTAGVLFDLHVHLDKK